MKRRVWQTAALLAATIMGSACAEAGTPLNNWLARRRARQYPWHGYYYHTGWGQPVAQVVPPTAPLQTHWSWGVAQTSVTPIWHQFRHGWPGPYEGGIGFWGTPRWPSHTDQFGVYYVRGPW
jgi:hypothetical protein